MSKLVIDSRTDWTPDILKRAWDEIAIISEEELELVPGKDLYPNQFEVVSAEQMLDAYSSIGLPVHYNHWSFGKEFLQNAKQYEKGRMGLAYEMVINSNPCVNLLMEENLAYMQVMVMAHAGVGHNAVFANNVYFKEWTSAGSIIDYMLFARDYIRSCEDRYGTREVEEVLDAAHSVSMHGIDKYKRRHRPQLSEEQRLAALMAEDDRRQRELDIILKRTTIAEDTPDTTEDTPEEDEENLLYYIMKKSPNLARWKREILRIVYKVNQYFSPQGPTKTLNEGFATFSHYYIMKRLEEKGIITPDAYIAYLQSHSGVIYQPNYNSRHYSGPNPYALGFAILQDVKRICEEPTAEDREWFPNLIGKRWQGAM
jgi:spore cortex formation protein SpoVR/YcgB (stage V sporulation)